MRTQKANAQQKEIMRRLSENITSAIDDAITTEILNSDDAKTDTNLLMTALINAAANSLCLLHRGTIPISAVRMPDERFVDGVSDAFKVVMKRILKDNPAIEFEGVKH